MSACVYVLCDPKTNAVRYVGQTADLETRYQRHLHPRGSDKTHRANWIRSLLSNGKAPVVTVIEQCTPEGAYEREQFWIEYYRAAGCDLVNSSDGGPGLKNPPADVRKKKSDALMGHSVSEKTRRAVSLAHKGKPLSAEQRRKLSLSGKGKPHTNRGRPLSDAHKQKVSQSLLGNQRRKGILHTAESKLKMSLARKGKPHSPEHRAKLAEANRRRAATARGSG